MGCCVSTSHHDLVPTLVVPPDDASAATIRVAQGSPSRAISARPSQTTLVPSISAPDNGELKSVASVPSGLGAPPEQPPQIATPGTKRMPAKGNKNYPTSTSTVGGVLSDDFRFRILVAGKRDSGKSSLIHAIFKANMSEAGANMSGEINDGFRPRDNLYLMLHEYSGFDHRDVQTIKNFVVTRRGSNRSESERLHAIWICVSVLDLIDGKLDKEVKAILGIGVPVVLVFTKFDIYASRVQSGTTSGELEGASYTAYAVWEQSCRSLFNRNTGDVPAAIVSTEPGFDSLISKLVTTTDQLIMAHSCNTLELSRAQKARLRMSPVLLAWSITQRASHHIIIQTVIEVGRSKYWRGLSSDKDFVGYTLESYLDAIHTDIVDVWNFPDTDKYLWSEAFKVELFYFIKDLNRISTLSRPKQKGTQVTKPASVAALRLNDPYQNSKENICCVMGYIVDLTAILCALFRSPGYVTIDEVRSAIKDFVDSDRMSIIHAEICSFIAAELVLIHLERDVVIEKVIDLIKQYCVLPVSK